MDPAQIEFLAERALVKIVPKFSEAPVPLIQGEVGPFKAGIPIDVPLWVAADLRRRQKCRIVQPDWMDVEVLESLKDVEKDAVGFADLPHGQLFVLAQLLLDVATADINKADEIRTLIRDIWDVRQAKLRKVADSFVQSGALRATINNVQLIEMNTVRPLLPHALDLVYRMEIAASDVARRRNQDSSISLSHHQSAQF